MKIKSIYLIGSLANPKVPVFANTLRKQGYEVFDDWWGAGFEADVWWNKYEKIRGRKYEEALKGHAATHIYGFDKKFLDLFDAGVMMLPAGKSGHLELGYKVGTGSPGFILLDKEPKKFDVMYKFATGIFTKQEDLLKALKKTY